MFPPYRTPDGDYQQPSLHVAAARRGGATRTCAPSDEAVRFIGSDPRLKVAAQYNLLPHLAGRPYIYELEHAREADVVALQLDGGT